MTLVQVPAVRRDLISVLFRWAANAGAGPAIVVLPPVPTERASKGFLSALSAFPVAPESSTQEQVPPSKKLPESMPANGCAPAGTCLLRRSYLTLSAVILHDRSLVSPMAEDISHSHYVRPTRCSSCSLMTRRGQRRSPAATRRSSRSS